MPFSFTNYQPGTPEQVNPYHAALQHAFQTFGKGIQTGYLPQTIEADIFSKKFAPLAQIASNPLAMAMMGDKGVGIMQMISELLHQQGPGSKAGIGSENISNMQPEQLESNVGGINAPQTSSQNYGAPNRMSDQGVEDLSQQITNKTITDAEQGYNPSLPTAGQGVGAGAVAQALGPTQKQTQEGGTLFYDPMTNKTYSQPSSTTVQLAQSSYNAIKQLLPQLNDIASESKEFLEPKGRFGILASKLAGHLIGTGLLDRKTAEDFNIDPEKQSRYNAWQTDINFATERLFSAFPNLNATKDNVNLVHQALMPVPGETDKGYRMRVIKTISHLNEQQIPALQQQMGRPIDLTQQNSSIDNQGQQAISNIKKIGNQEYHLIAGQWLPVLGGR